MSSPGYSSSRHEPFQATTGALTAILVVDAHNTVQVGQRPSRERPAMTTDTETSTIDVWSDTVPGPRQRYVYRRTGRPATGARFEHVARDYHYVTTTVIEPPTT